ncbi:MAG: globin [Polyangiaceae bacterium]|nr:globin [Polyangiaceae bacterium]
MTNPIRESFDRARQAGFAERFYSRLLDADPAIRARFSKTDFQRQRELLTHAIYSMLDYAEGKAMGKMALERLAKLHEPTRLDIPPYMYDHWLRCFLATLGEADSQMNDELLASWRDALRPGIRLMTSTYTLSKSRVR